MTSESRDGATGDLVPRPDPTLLTTQQLLREMSALKELLFTRLEGMDRATDLLHANFTQVPSDVDRAVTHLKDLHDERFTSIETQFRERDVRVEQTARDTKVAVDAALQAAEKAANAQYGSFAQSIEKSEAATAKQIDALNAALQAAAGALDAKINDSKDRLTRIESYGIGRVETQDRAQSQGNVQVGWLIGAGGLLLGLGSFAYALVK